MKLYIQLAGIFLASVLNAQTAYTRYVNPFVGTGGHGHTFPGATTPFGMVQLSPDTRIDGSWDGCSGYHYSDTVIYGFSHTHLSGTGCSDYGDINFMPTFVSKPIKPITSEGKLFYTFDRKTESASPGYYTVALNNGIKVELSATARTGIQKYTYKRTGYAWITLDLNHRDQLLEGLITETDKQTYSGFRRSKAWAENQLVYFYTTISRAAEARLIVKDSAGNCRLHLGYWVKAGESILVKTALSSVSEAGAKLNMDTELSHWDFGKVRREAEQVWEKELRRIRVYGGSLTEKRNFYTALYHCMIHPNVMNDVDGQYRGRDKQVHKAEGFNYYTVFSLWDTYRALHPLLHIIDKNRSRDFIMTFKAQYEQSGRLPMWELWGNETNCMIGFHSVSVIWNAYIRGVISKEELSSIYPAVYSEAMSNRFGLEKFRERGYLTAEDEHESVSKTLEYAFNMHCVSRIADALGNDNDAEYFKKLSWAWKNLRDTRTGFMTPRSNGAWLKDFDPARVDNHFTEANSWQYSFAVQHYAVALFKVAGPRKTYYNDTLLSRLFSAGSKTTGREQADITGLLGQYAHGNEPSHHVAYLFLQRDSIKKYVKKICKEMYRPTSDGLCGNEDCGQMSAWYVFSAMGFYPADPSDSKMVLGNMLFDSVRFVQGDKEAVMYNKVCPEPVYSSSFSFNRMAFGSEPAYYTKYEFGDQEGPFTNGRGYDPQEFLRAISAPVFVYESQVFPDSIEVYILPNDPELDYGQKRYKIYYTTDGSDPGPKSMIYDQSKPLRIHNSCILKARIVLMRQTVLQSDLAEAAFYRYSNNYDITLKSKYNPQYTAGGNKGIMDGLKGDADWRKGRWQGYQGQDFEILIDAKKQIQADTILFGTLQDTRSWILYPDSVVVYGSADSLHFEVIGTCKNTIPDSMMKSTRLDFAIPCKGNAYRYFRIFARNYGHLPAWHPGAGGDAFIFVDEIEIRSKR